MGSGAAVGGGEVRRDPRGPEGRAWVMWVLAPGGQEEPTSSKDVLCFCRMMLEAVSHFLGPSPCGRGWRGGGVAGERNLVGRHTENGMDDASSSHKQSSSTRPLAVPC